MDHYCSRPGRSSQPLRQHQWLSYAYFASNNASVTSTPPSGTNTSIEGDTAIEGSNSTATAVTTDHEETDQHPHGDEDDVLTVRFAVYETAGLARRLTYLNILTIMRGLNEALLADAHLWTELRFGILRFQEINGGTAIPTDTTVEVDDEAAAGRDGNGGQEGEGERNSIEKGTGVSVGRGRIFYFPPISVVGGGVGVGAERNATALEVR